MPLLHFTTNRAADDRAAIHSACLFDQTDGLCATTAAEQENPSPLRLSSTTTTIPSNASLSPNSPEHNHIRILTDISPSNPAILLTRSSTDPDSRPFVCSAITIVSSARTMELYISGEYAGTFRGESFLPSTPSFTPSGTGGAGPAGPPLFLIQIDQESLLHRCRNLVFKFFIPKKPTAFQDLLSIHWLIVQGALPPPSPSLSLNHGPPSQNTPQQPAATVHTPITSTPVFPSPLVSSSSSTSVQLGNSPSMTQFNINGATATVAADNATGPTATTYNDILTTPTPHISLGYAPSSLGHSSSQNLDNQTSPNFSAFASTHSYMMSPAINDATSIDLDKVRQLLSQVQIDNMPQGAKDLMRTMEMQSLALQQQKASSFLSSEGGYPSPSHITPPLPSLAYTASTTATSSLPPLPPQSPLVMPALNTTTATSTPPSGSLTAEETTILVTKVELALLEERIMTKIEQRFQEMEDRILNKLLLATKQPNA